MTGGAFRLGPMGFQLLPQADVKVWPRLHAAFRFGRRDYIVAMDQITTVRTTDIQKVVGSARANAYEITRAYDTVIAGV